MTTVLDEAFQALADRVGKIALFAGPDPKYAAMLTEDALAQIEILRKDAGRAEWKANVYAAQNLQMGQPTTMELGHAMALQKIYIAAQESIQKGYVTQSLRDGVAALDAEAQAGDPADA
jgi:hypothetical protein